MMGVRTATAEWQGDLKAGNGTMTIGGRFEGPFTFSSRFEEGLGSNPEELLAAAHAGCFSMALSNDLSASGHTPVRVSTTANVTLGSTDAGATITTIELVTEAEVPGIDPAEFQKIAEGTKTGCPVSRALAGPEIRLQATLQ